MQLNSQFFIVGGGILFIFGAVLFLLSRLYKVVFHINRLEKEYERLEDEGMLDEIYEKGLRKIRKEKAESVPKPEKQKTKISKEKKEPKVQRAVVKEKKVKERPAEKKKPKEPVPEKEKPVAISLDSSVVEIESKPQDFDVTEVIDCREDIDIDQAEEIYIPLPDQFDAADATTVLDESELENTESLFDETSVLEEEDLDDTGMKEDTGELLSLIDEGEKTDDLTSLLDELEGVF